MPTSLEIFRAKQAFNEYTADLRTYVEKWVPSDYPRLLVYGDKHRDHFYERMLGRNLDKQHVGGALTKLLEEHYCELITILTQAQEDKPLAPLFSIAVYYKSVVVVLKVRKYDDNRYHLYPVTCMPSNRKTTAYVYMDLNEEKVEWIHEMEPLV